MGPFAENKFWPPPNGFWFLRPFPANIPQVCADLYPRAWLCGIPAIWKEIPHKICVDVPDGVQKKKKLCPMLRTYYVNKSVHKHH